MTARQARRKSGWDTNRRKEAGGKQPRCRPTIRKAGGRRTFEWVYLIKIDINI